MSATGPGCVKKTKLQESVVILFGIFLGAWPKVEIKQASPAGASPKWCAVPSAKKAQDWPLVSIEIQSL
jgi:hypothetical protein